MSRPLELVDPRSYTSPRKGWEEVTIGTSLGGGVQLPIGIVRGESDGPTVLVVAGVHGDEYEGPMAVARFFTSVDPTHLSGTFVCLPVVNPYAFEAQKRESDAAYDGLNLARQFPGTPGGSPTQRLADELYRFATELLGPDDLFIDLHSGGTRYEFLPMVGYHSTDDTTETASLEMARAFGLKRVWRVPKSPSSTKTYNGTVARAGIPTLGTEMPGRGGAREVDVESLVEGLGNVLIAKRMLPGNVESVPSEVGTVTQMVSCNASGLLHVCVDLDEEVGSGDLLAQISTLRGDTVEEIVAPVEGNIWAIRRFASVRPGDLVFMIAKA